MLHIRVLFACTLLICTLAFIVLIWRNIGFSRAVRKVEVRVEVPALAWNTPGTPEGDTANVTFKRLVQKGQACVLPDLPIMPVELKTHFRKPKPLECSEQEENWVYINHGRLYISDKAIQHHGTVQCNITSVRRKDDFHTEYGETLTNIKNGELVPSDFVLVSCVGGDKANFLKVLSGISPTASKLRQNKHEIGNERKNSFDMNILMFGFDSVSRLTWIRNLPKSYEYLVSTLGGVVLEGYNIVGDGTPQALLPILTGKTEEDLPEARRGFRGARQVDGHPWIWRDLKKLGYVSQWGEDSPGMGTFTYRMLGFKDQPTDHYLRMFYIENKKLKNNKHSCIGSLSTHENMLNWIRELYRVYPNTPKFSFLFHAEYTHGSTNKLQVADEELLQFLAEMNSSGHLNNTLLILMADHGARFQALRGTEQGKFEERLPFMSITPPYWFRKKYHRAMDNLKTNAFRLTTPFDIHATFHHILNFTSVGLGSVLNRGISLFNEIPKERECSHSGMEAHWCSCLQWDPISTNSSTAKVVAKSLVHFMNSLTETHRTQCAELFVDKIQNAAKYGMSDTLLKFKKTRGGHGRIPVFSDKMNKTEEIYQITILTGPNNGLYEATVKYSLKTKNFIVSENEISRINRYGDQPVCVADQFPHLRPYCLCKERMTN